MDCCVITEEVEMPKSDTSDPKELARSLIAEFFATGLFVFYGTGAFLSCGEWNNYDGGDNSTSRIAPISFVFGLATTFLLYSVGEFSEGFMNPAIALFLVAIKKITPARGACYMVVQFIAGLVGSFLLWAVTSEGGVRNYNLGVNNPSAAITGPQGFLFEIMGTMLILMTVLFTWVKKGGPVAGKPSLSYLCIGLAVMAANLVLIPFTSCGCNPARTLGPAIVGILVQDDSDIFFGDNVWIFYFGPFVAALIATAINFVYEDPVVTRDSSQPDQL